MGGTEDERAIWLAPDWSFVNLEAGGCVAGLWITLAGLGIIGRPPGLYSSKSSL